MVATLLVLALVASALVGSSAFRTAASRRARRTEKLRRGFRPRLLEPADPGRERRAEQRARELLQSCVNEEEWSMYRELGFIRVPGRLAPARSESPAAGWGRGAGSARSDTEPPYAYLIYPHKPIVAYVPGTQRLLSEYCVEFPDLTGAISDTRLPDSDDVLAKWMAVTGDESRLLRSANMHLPGRQVDPGRVRRDLWRLAEWERQRPGPDSVEASSA